MSTYLISYDLIWPETSSDYKNIIDYIKSLGWWAKPLESFYFVISNKNISDIRDELKTITDNNDKIIVMNVTWDGWATAHIPREVTDWMKENI